MTAPPRFALACASHTPLLMEERYADADTCNRVQASFDRMAGMIRSFAPDRIVQFSPDHFHGFHYDMMPSFCVGTAARSCGDWMTSAGPLTVDEAFALALLHAVRDAEIDAAVSYDMVVDHGFVQMWEVMFGSFADLPITPVFVNAIGLPLPTYRRARLLGEAVGRFAAETGERVLFVASGGLSHDPVVPRMAGASPELRSRLIGQAVPDPQQQVERERNVHSAAANAMVGLGPCRPLNSVWDERFLDLLERRDFAELDRFTAEGVDASAGAGANEVLAWIAATAAMASASDAFSVVQRDYVAVPGWIAGMAHFSGLSH